MKKLKEITAIIANEQAEKKKKQAFAKTQKHFMQRIEEISASGQFCAHFDKKEYTYWKELVEWLVRLGYRCVESADKEKVYINWDSAITTQGFNFKSSSGTISSWTLDGLPADYVCENCSNHSKRKTPYCPYCGAKMISD